MKKLALCLAAALAAGTAVHAKDKPPQIVIISFDGAADNVLWKKSMDMAARNGAHFTYFLSCTFLMSPDERTNYRAPHQHRGRSNVGFAQSTEEISERLDHIWNAHLAGHEIGSHGCGHFDGADWSKADWMSELETFRQVLANAYEANGLENRKPPEWDGFAANEIKGFRAPYLSVSPALTGALSATGFTYDASQVSNGPQWPQNEGKITRFSLPMIPEGPHQRPIIAMDYNLFVRHSNAVENTNRSAEFEDRAYNAFRAAFDRQYSGDRTPLQLGFHFVEMNGGAYWRALDWLTSEVCAKPDVDCITYGEALERLNRDEMTKAGNSGL